MTCKFTVISDVRQAETEQCLCVLGGIFNSGEQWFSALTTHYVESHPGKIKPQNLWNGAMAHVIFKKTVDFNLQAALKH